MASSDMVLKSGANFDASCQVPLHLGGCRAKQVEDVAALAIAQLDAERIHQDQPRQTVTARRRDLSREPAPERETHQRHVRQRLEQVEVEMHQVIDRIEISGTR